MKLALNLAYRLQKVAWKLLRPRTRGVKVMLFNRNGEIMLIRNSYGESSLFVLPGGGIRPFEDPARAVRREINEELGCDAERITLLSTYSSRAEGKRDTIHLFKADTMGDPRPDNVEVVEAAFFRLDDLPPTTSPATRRRVAEYRRERDVHGDW